MASWRPDGGALCLHDIGDLFADDPEPPSKTTRFVVPTEAQKSRAHSTDALLNNSEVLLQELRMALDEEVFRLSGLPTYTSVEPVRYDEIKISVRTPGRCCVIEGPSGIGKTTTVTKAIEAINLQDRVMSLSARRVADIELIAELPAMQDIGTVIVDDFHRLSDEVKSRLSDYMKVLADSGSDKSKLILIGINKAGQQLVKFAHDLGMRIDVFKLEANPNDKIEELISLGERALNVKILAKESRQEPDRTGH